MLALQCTATKIVVRSHTHRTFYRPYGKALKEKGYSMKLRGEDKTAAQAYDDLIEAINNVYFDVVANPSINNGKINPNQHRMEYDLFRNHFSVIDGPCYAFVVHGKGPAVGGQGLVFSEDDAATSSKIVIKDNTIDDIICWTKEIPCMFDLSCSLLSEIPTILNPKPSFASLQPWSRIRRSSTTLVAQSFRSWMQSTCD